MPAFEDLTGQKFGRLTPIRRGPNSKSFCTQWFCLCDCGNETLVLASNLKTTGTGRVQSCGCYHRENVAKLSEKIHTTHGRTSSKEVNMLSSAKQRAKQQGVSFTLLLEDIVIPDVCPALGIPLIKGNGPRSDGSPTLDRIIPKKGYVKENVCVISWRANALKNNASLEELEKIVSYMKEKTRNGS